MGATAFSPHVLDGKSFKAALTDSPHHHMKDWRQYSYSEFYVGDDTWRNIRFINATSGEAEWSFHWWCSNQSEVFHKPTDPYQMINVGGDTPTAFGRQIEDRYLSATEALGKCTGQSCNEMPAPMAAKKSLRCGVIGELSEAEEAFLDPDSAIVV